MACGVVGFEGYLPVPFGLSQPRPSTFRAWPRSVASSLPSRAGRVVLKDPGQRKGIICQCVFYMAVGIFGIIASRPGGRKKIPFSCRTGSCSTFETAAVTSLAASFGQGTDYPVVIATANRKCPQQVKPGALFRCLRGLFSPRRGSFVPNRARKSSEEPGPPFRLAPLCDLLTVYCAKSPW